MSSFASEHRKQTRVSCALAVQVHAPGEDVLLFTYATNLSDQGVYVRANRPLPEGSAVSLDLQPGTPSERLKLDGVVVRAARTKGGPRGMGIAFVEMRAHEREALSRLLSRLDKNAMLTVADAETFSSRAGGSYSNSSVGSV